MRRWLKYVIAAIIVLAVVRIAYEAKGQSCPGDYGCAQFYRTDAWPRDGLIEHWVLDPGVRGDSMAGAGDFESWTGTEGGCTDCPESWICDCTTYGGDVDQSSTYLYRSDISLVLDPAGAFSCLTSYIMTLTQFETYQIRFCYRGGGGTEDLLFGVGNLTMTDTYDFSNDVFSGALTMEAFANVGTTWTCASYYLYVGATTKIAYYVAFATQTGDGTAIYVDDVSVSRLYAREVIGERENVLSVDTGSDQVWGRSEVLLPRTGGGPAYHTGMELDETDDFLSCDDADCEMDPANWAGGGKISVGCRVVTDSIAAGSHYIVSKWAGGGQAGWGVRRNADNITFIVSDDGVNTDTNSVVVLTVGPRYDFISTFDPSGGSGACENNIYYDAYQVDTDATMTECVPFDSSADFEVGALSDLTLFWGGSILECSLWEKELSAIEANKYISPYFPGSNYNDGFYVDTCSQAASHATCSTQICRDGTPNACQAEGTGTIACFGGYTELLDNNSFESYAGDPSVANFSDWTESGNVTAYLADMKHGDVSARMTGGSLVSECLTTGPGTDIYVELSAKNLEEGTTIEIWLREYDTGICTTQLALNTLITCTPGGIYDDCGALFELTAWNVATSSYTIQIVDTVDGDVLIDNVSVKQASYHTPWVHCPTGSGSVAYNSRQYELHNPLSDYCESEDADCYASGFCASGWIFNEWSNDGIAHFIINVPGTVGNNNRWDLRKDAADAMIFYIYDSAAATRTVSLAVNDTNFTSGDWKYWEICSNNSDNTISGHWYNVSNSTWYDLGAIGGAGTGIHDDQSTGVSVGHFNNASYFDGYQSEIHISPYSAIYPNIGFNNGNPPVNGSPY